MIFIFRRNGSDGAQELTKFREEGFIRLRSGPAQAGPDRPMDNIRWRRAERESSRFSVVCWGEHVPGVASSVRILNNAPLLSKYKQALLLKEKGVATIEVAASRPSSAAVVVPPPPPFDATDHALIGLWGEAAHLADDFLNIGAPSRSDPARDGVKELAAAFAALRDELINGHAPVAPPAPPPPTPVPDGEWLGRLNSHIAGNDLLNPPARPDFYVKKETLVAEYRVHSFRGVSIRAGKKIPVEGGSTHPWVRSSVGGWKISYDGRSVKQRHRDIAHEAVKALGLDFGAVDLAEKSDGSLIVLEVNRAPGLDGGTITQYVKHIKRWDAGLAPVEEE